VGEPRIVLNPPVLTPLTRWVVGVLVGLFVVAIAGPIAYFGPRHDSRFCWQMFAHVVQYRVQYYWVRQDGRARSYYPKSGELRGHAYGLLAPRKRLVHHGTVRHVVYKHLVGYDVGFVRSLVDQYCRFKATGRQHSSYRGFRAIVSYQKDFGPSRQMVVWAPCP
jgi:hypothetical protein